MQQLPSGYTANHVTPESPNYADIFETIEWIARDEGSGADTETQTLICALNYGEDQVVGGVWYDLDDKYFSFHIAISPEHQSKGLSHYLINEAMDTYEELKFENPDLKIYVLSINPRMTEAMYKQGFVVTENCADDSAPYSYQLEPVDSVFTIIRSAHQNDAEEFLSAIEKCATACNKAPNVIAEALRDWAEAPFGTKQIAIPAAEATALFNQLPLAACHQSFLHAQHRITSPDAAKPPREEPGHYAEVAPSVSPEYKPRR